MDLAQLVDHYSIKAIEEDLSISEVRKEVKKLELEEEIVHTIVWLVDHNVQKVKVAETHRVRAKNNLLVGVFLLCLSLAMTFTGFFGLIVVDHVFLIAFGPFAAGLYMILSNLRKAKRPSKKSKLKR